MQNWPSFKCEKQESGSGLNLKYEVYYFLLVNFIQARKLRNREAGLEVFPGGRKGEKEVIQEVTVLSLKTY